MESNILLLDEKIIDRNEFEKRCEIFGKDGNIVSAIFNPEFSNRLSNGKVYITKKYNPEFTGGIDIHSIIGTVDKIYPYGRLKHDDGVFADLSINYLNKSGLDACCKINNGYKYRFEPRILLEGKSIKIIDFAIIFEEDEQYDN